MAIVWPCAVSVDAYVAAGRQVQVPRPDCPDCGAPMSFWSGYWRHVRADGRCRKIFVPRAHCPSCEATHALLPGFVLASRLDVVDTIGTVVVEVLEGTGGVRPAAERAGVPHTTARDWLRRFGVRARQLAVSFAALAVELSGDAMAPLADDSGWALSAIRAAFRAASALPGWLALGCWRFVSAVTGGALIATNTNSPYLIIGRRRFMPPIPNTG